MSQEITIVVKGTNLSKGALKEPADDLDKLKAEAASAGAGMDRFEAKTTQARDELGRFMSKTREAGDSVRGLGDEFERTSRESQGWLRGLRDKVNNLFGDGGKHGAKAFADGFTSSLKPTAITAAILAAVTLAPGALLAATGLAGIGVGIIGQLQNPAIGTAASQVGHDIMARLAADTAPFEKPLIGALDTLGKAAQDALDSIDFGNLATEIEPLASGIGALVTNLMPGLNKAFQAAMPVVDTLAASLPMLGDALSQMFEDMSKGGRGAQEGIYLLVATLATLAITVGLVVEGVSRFVEGITNAGERISWWVATITAPLHIIGNFTNKIHDMWRELQRAGEGIVTAGRALHGMGGAAALSADDLGTLAGKLNETKMTADSLEAAIVDKLFNGLMSLDQATLTVAESQTRLQESFRENGRNIDIHTAAGQRNREAILAQLQANERLYQAEVASGTSASVATAHYDNNTEALRRQMHAAGLTDGQIESLIGTYARVPDTVDTNVATHGLTDALNNMGMLLAKINGLDGKDFGFTVTETFRYQQETRERINDNMGHSEHGGIIGAATGGIHGGLRMVGEHGRELVRLPVGSTVIPNGSAENMLAGIGAGGGRSGAVSIDVSFSGDIDSGGARWIQKLIRDGKIKISSKAIVSSSP